MENLYQEFIALGVYLSEKGYIAGSAGNLSIKRDDNHILCTPTHANLGALKPGALSVITLDGERLEGEKPTKEVAFHQAIYKKYAQAKAIIHLHSTYLTALSCLNNLDPKNVIKAFTPYVVMRLGNIPLIPYFRPGSPQIVAAIDTLPNEISGFLMANHGVTVFGENMKEACHKFEELEETAKLYFLLKNQDIRYLSDTEIEELIRG